MRMNLIKTIVQLSINILFLIIKEWMILVTSKLKEGYIFSQLVNWWKCEEKKIT